MSNSMQISDNRDSSRITYTFVPKLVINGKTSTIYQEKYNETKPINETYVHKSAYEIDKKFDGMVKQCTEKYESIFYDTCIQEYIEDGFISESQRLYNIMVQEYGKSVSGTFLNNIYKKHAQNSKILKSLLFILGQIDPKDLKGAEAILGFSISNRDYEIKDLALQCFEKWGDKQYLVLLKSIDTGVEYLQKYIESIIEEIESDI